MISYRREDSSAWTGRVYDRLVDEFGEDKVFLDIDTIEPGEDFVQAIEAALGFADVLVAVIGKRWLEGIEDHDDFVRLEVTTALRLGKRVVPVLVDDAQMPSRVELPESLAPLSRRNAVRLNHIGFRADVGRLVDALKKTGAVPQSALAGHAKDRSATLVVPELQPSRESKDLVRAVSGREALRARKPRKAARAGDGRPSRKEGQSRAGSQRKPSTKSRLAAGTILTSEGDVQLLPIPGGVFLMGSADPTGRLLNERPQHEVHIAAFQIGRYLVTNEEYSRYLEVDHGAGRPFSLRAAFLCDPRQPVVGVSWHGARRFAQWVGCRLPSESEWEYAARAGTTARYIRGETPADLDAIAWPVTGSGVPGIRMTHRVGHKAPNPWGLYDVLGNALEWTEDAYYPNYDGAPADGSARLEGVSQRELTGDSANDDGKVLRVIRGYASEHGVTSGVTARGYSSPSPSQRLIGFRIARSL